MNMLKIAYAVLFIAISACASTASQPSYKWTEFVQVDGQPEPVPAEWVSTPEGKFAHSLKIPNPVPKDSGYKPWMSSEAYFKHLCEKEAGEFIFKTVDNVEGFYFMRPPRRPTDEELRNPYLLEDPELERMYQLREAEPKERAKIFVNPPWANFRFIEEPAVQGIQRVLSEEVNKIFGYEQGKSSMVVEKGRRSAKYALAWRGVKRPTDRENRIAGGEMIIVELKTNEILAVRRNFVLSPSMRNNSTGIWWLNATSCPMVPRHDDLDSQFLYKFTSKILRPMVRDRK